MSGVSLMTDGNGAVFRRRAIEAVRDDVGLHLLEELKGWMQSVRVNGLDAPDTETERRELEKELEGYNGREIETLDGESVQVEIQNPAEALEEVSRQGILRLTVADCESLSAAVINSGGLIQSRMAQEKTAWAIWRQHGQTALRTVFSFRNICCAIWALTVTRGKRMC